MGKLFLFEWNTTNSITFKLCAPVYAESLWWSGDDLFRFSPHVIDRLALASSVRYLILEKINLNRKCIY